MPPGVGRARPERHQPLALGRDIVGFQVEPEWKIGRVSLLATLEEQARQLAVGVNGRGIRVELRGIEAGGEQPLQELVVGRPLDVLECSRPECRQPRRIGAGERDVEEERPLARPLVGALDAEAVSFGVAHHRPRLAEVADRARLRLDELRADAEQALDLALAVGGVDVEVDRDLDRPRLRCSNEPERQTGAVRIHDRVGSVARIAEDVGPEPGEAVGIGARERDVAQARHASAA